MRLFHITSDKYTGTVEVVYDGNDVLLQMRFGAQLSEQQMHYLKSQMPLRGNELHDKFSAAPIKIEEKPFDITFEEFKREYPYNRNMHLAAPAFAKLSSSDQYLLFSSCIKYRKYCDRNNWYKPMLPERYIKTMQWLNNWDKL